jgi:flagellar basal body-associated protein FliL
MALGALIFYISVALRYRLVAKRHEELVKKKEEEAKEAMLKAEAEKALQAAAEALEAEKKAEEARNKSKETDSWTAWIVYGILLVVVLVGIWGVFIRDSDLEFSKPLEWSRGDIMREPAPSVATPPPAP